PRYQDGHRLSAGVVDHALQHLRGLATQQRRDGLDAGAAGRGHLRHRLELGEGNGPRLGSPRRGRLQVGGIVALLAVDELVLADVGDGNELVVDVTTDLPRIRLDDSIPKAATVTD